VLHRLDGHDGSICVLACIASSSAAPHHPRLVSTSMAHERRVRVWDGETGELLADLKTDGGGRASVVVWKEHTGGHDRIAAAAPSGVVQVWDGESFELLYNLAAWGSSLRLLAFKSAEGPARLLVLAQGEEGDAFQVWDPEEGRLMRAGINRGCPADNLHMFESAEGRHLLAIGSRGEQHPRHLGDTVRAFLDVWDLGEAPVPEGRVRPAHKHGWAGLWFRGGGLGPEGGSRGVASRQHPLHL
jgi:hypothetical protein